MKYYHKIKLLEENNFPHKKNKFTRGYLELTTGIKDSPTCIEIQDKFDKKYLVSLGKLLV